ncbi:MAG: transposase [Rhodobacteraceae bacterium]|nr:transposase [Paracoccaceae bacterium]
MAGLQGSGLIGLSGPSRALARNAAKELADKFGKSFPSALTCFEDDFDACIARLRMPVSHRRAIRTTNLLERLFVEERRRLKIIPNAWGEKPVLKLMFGAMMRASERWKSIKGMKALRKELDEEYRSQVQPVQATTTGTRPSNLSGKIRT